MTQHDRTLDHYGVEPDSTTVLAAQIGRYAAGVDVHTVLADFDRRLLFIEANATTRVIGFTADAVVYGPRSFTADAIVAGVSYSLVADAVVRKVPTGSVTGDAYLIEHVGGQATLSAGIDDAVTTITISNPATFPFSGSFIILIDNEQMLVTAGGGTTTWTVTRGYLSTVAASHASGALTVELC